MKLADIEETMVKYKAEKRVCVDTVDILSLGTNYYLKEIQTLKKCFDTARIFVYTNNRQSSGD